MTAATILALIWIPSAIVMIVLILRARPGFQDAAGFHELPTHDDPQQHALDDGREGEGGFHVHHKEPSI